MLKIGFVLVDYSYTTGAIFKPTSCTISCLSKIFLAKKVSLLIDVILKPDQYETIQLFLQSFQKLFNRKVSSLQRRKIELASSNSSA